MLYLAQTDTTAGFLSKDFREINRIKNRPLNTPCLLTMAEFGALSRFSRVPNSHKNFIRKAKKTSFILTNSRSFRVVKNHPHAAFLREFGAFFSSSANLHGKKFDANLAKKITLKNGGKVLNDTLFEGKASKIYKLHRNKKRKIR